MRTMALTVLVGAIAASTAHAQATASQKAAVDDALFAQAAAAGGMAELPVRELGGQKATDAELKKFSQFMIDEHTKINNELKTLAARKRLPLPTMLDARALFCERSLAGLNGGEFDRCFAKGQFLAHLET